MSKKLIARRHPDYQNLSKKWVFFKQSYDGGEDYIKPNLFKYFKEGDEEYDARVERAYRENHSKRVVDLINGYLFKEDASRNTENKMLSEFYKNFDGSGKGVTRFMKGASQWASVCGRIYLVCDKKQLPEEEKTGTQRDNLNPAAQPYCYTVFPQDVLDIAFDDDGKIKWALIHERKRDDDDPHSSSGEVKDVYRLWERGKWTLYNAEGEQIEDGVTGINVVPIVIVDNEEQDEYTGQSLVGDIAYLDRAIFNNWSRLDTIVCDQTFSQLIFPIEGLPAEIAEDEELRKKFLTLATNRVILYSAMAQAAPTYIAPDAGQADFILRMIEKQVKQLYGILGLQAETGTEVQAQSGVAKSYDFDKLNKLLANKADNLEQAERQIVEIYKRWMGNVNIECEIDYPDEFDVKSLADEISMASELALLDISETFTKEILKSVALKALNKPEQDIVKQIMDEIDAKTEDELTATKKGNFDFDQEGANGQNQTQRQAN